MPPFALALDKETGHALDIAVDDRGADPGDHPDLVVHALK